MQDSFYPLGSLPVSLGPKPVERSRRLMAKIVDGVVFIIPLFASLGLAAVLTEFLNGESARGAVQACAWLCFVTTSLLLAGQCYSMVATGQTLGKYHYRLKVRALDGSQAGWARLLLLRCLLPTLAMIMTGSLSALPDWLLCLREDRRCFHDFLAGTIVVEA